MKNLKDIIIEQSSIIPLLEKLKINSKSKISKHTYQPKDKTELRKIIKKRLEKDKNAYLNDIDVSNIIDMKWLFDKLDPHNIDISEWNMSNVTMTRGMFYKCENFNCDLSNWDVSNIINMRSMFYGCKNFNCDLSNWNVSNVKIMSWIFEGCTSLKKLPKWYKK